MQSSVKENAKKLIPTKLLSTRARIIYHSRVKKVLKNRVRKSFNPKKYPMGINVMGPVKGEIGLGQSCRLLIDAINSSGMDFTLQNYDLFGSVRSEDNTWAHLITNETPYGINIIHMEPTELMFRCVEFDKDLWNEKYNIAFWLWELEKFPKEWIPAIELVDEIWTPSEFTSNSIRKVTEKPVRTLPYSVSAPVDDKYSREYFKLPEDKFLFLIMFDSNSTMVRKNPFGAIEAYKKTFSPDDDSVGLVIKTNNTEEKKLEPIKKLLDGYKNVYFVTDILEKKAVNSLIADVDVFVSLHRAEGFGLVMAEAMLNHTPCIATNWSSNTEFMNDKVACMVDYTFTTLNKEMSPYRKGSRWADANTDSAANYMKRLKEDSAFYNEIAENASAFVNEKFNLIKAGENIKREIDRILKDYE